MARAGSQLVARIPYPAPLPWLQYYEHLVNAHPVNRTALREIEASAFAVCLDDSAPTDHVSQTRGLLHGDGMNRWYDKNLQFIVCENGKAGFMGEVRATHTHHQAMPAALGMTSVDAPPLPFHSTQHSAMDGSPTSHMINWVLHGYVAASFLHLALHCSHGCPAHNRARCCAGSRMASSPSGPEPPRVPFRRLTSSRSTCQMQSPLM